jgi:poly(3-hydroxybutyrate) depolymerase
MPAQLLPAYIVSMFLELDLAHFGPVDAALHGGAGAEEPAGFTDVATLWHFVDAVRAEWCRVAAGVVLLGLSDGAAMCKLFVTLCCFSSPQHVAPCCQVAGIYRQVTFHCMSSLCRT